MNRRDQRIGARQGTAFDRQRVFPPRIHGAPVIATGAVFLDEARASADRISSSERLDRHHLELPPRMRCRYLNEVRNRPRMYDILGVLE